MKARIKNSGVGPTLPRRGLSLGSSGTLPESGRSPLYGGWEKSGLICGRMWERGSDLPLFPALILSQDEGQLFPLVVSQENVCGGMHVSLRKRKLGETETIRAPGTIPPGKPAPPIRLLECLSIPLLHLSILPFASFPPSDSPTSWPKAPSWGLCRCSDNPW